jgi:short-subunit dehydrogenase
MNIALTPPPAPPTVHYFPVDLASHPSILSACTAVKVRLGAPTILINNAGLARGKSVLAASESDIRLTFAVNTLSHYYLAQQFLPSMVEKNHGMIVTVASYAAYITAPAMVDYAASKAAALAFHEGISAELATTYKAPKVRTVVMCQNYTRTKLFEGFAGSALFAETVAEEIVKKVLRGRSAHVLMPESGWLVVSRMRGLPLWMQYGVRKRLANLMATWQGRQVEQPSVREEEEKREKEDKVGDRDDEKRGVEESGVLVPKEE